MLLQPFPFVHKHLPETKNPHTKKPKTASCCILNSLVPLLDLLLEQKDAGAKRKRLRVNSKLKNSTVTDTSSARTNAARAEGVTNKHLPNHTNAIAKEAPVCGDLQHWGHLQAGQHSQALETPPKGMFSIREIKHC